MYVYLGISRKPCAGTLFPVLYKKLGFVKGDKLYSCSNICANVVDERCILERAFGKEVSKTMLKPLQPLSAS